MLERKLQKPLEGWYKCTIADYEEIVLCSREKCIRVTYSVTTENGNEHLVNDWWTNKRVEYIVKGICEQLGIKYWDISFRELLERCTREEFYVHFEPTFRGYNTRHLRES